MSLIISTKDAYRQAVEAASGGRNTVMYDDRGNPSIMVAIPRFDLSDVIEGAPNTPHPAFIVNGQVKDVIYISKYQNIVHDSRAYSLPGLDPRASISFDQAKAACAAKGAGWHLMTNAEWAAIALWSKKNGTLPRGNNNYGKDQAYAYETAIPATKDAEGKTLRTKTGTGPVTWSHDHTTDGIYDLNGNVTEWVDGLKIVDGRIIHANDNDFTATESSWVQSNTYFDNVSGLVLNSSRTATTGTPGKQFGQLSAASGHTIPELFKYLAIAPHDATAIDDTVYANLEGERMALRGGTYNSAAIAGAFYLGVTHVRSTSDTNIGFRSAFVI